MTTTPLHAHGYRAGAGKPAWMTATFCGITFFILCGSAGMALLVGAIPVTTAQVVEALLRGGGDQAGVVIWSLRAPRVAVAVLAGACMATSGALMQGMTRNPLADPTLTGVAAGAACAIVVAQTCWPSLTPVWHPVLGILGGLLAAALTFALTWRERFSPAHLALAGLAVTAFATAGITTVLVISGPEAASLFFWLSGGLAGRGWEHVRLVWPWALAGALLALICARPLNLMALGDDAAQSLGLHLPAWRIACGAAAVMLAAAAVAVAGPLGFVGLCAPHLTRLCVGGDHRRLIPAAALFGAALVCVADLLARTVAAPRELPSGFFTALLSAPLLIRLIQRRGHA
ncbi:FecCD family ABC transporter permease [Noviherbaspirillum aridicola]|nr:iron ABC transporter permease [Noviherbaspirillum aridicola]